MPKADPTENDFIDVQNLNIENILNVAGKVVLVTGGGSGIGACIAAGFVRNGATVIISSRKDTSPWAEKLTKVGPGKCVSFHGIDLTKESDCSRLAERIEKEFGFLDCLINNSGTNWSDKFEKYPAKSWDKVFSLNTRAPFLLTQRCFPLLQKRATKLSPSSVIMISSINGLSAPALPTYAYSSSKAALTMLTKHLAPTLGQKNVTINTVCPGPFQSRMMKVTLKRFPVEKTTILNRIGSPEDIAGICIYFASRAGAFCTGTSVSLDGGTLVKGSKM